MAIEIVNVTITGSAGDDLQVWYRGDRDAETDDPAPIVFTGKIGTDGRLVLQLPRAYLILGRPNRRGGIPLNLLAADSEMVVSMPAPS